MTNNTVNPKFIRLYDSAENIKLPQHFTFPYYYTPHPLALLAVDHLQHYLETQQQWQHDFDSKGKMFAVLLVKNQQGELGYLASVAGEPCDSFEQTDPIPSFFVDAIYNKSQYQLATRQQQTELEHLAKHIHQLEHCTQFINIKQKIANDQRQAQDEIAQFQKTMAAAKKARKQQRADAETSSTALTSEQLTAIITELGNQSSREKTAFKQLKHDWQNSLTDLTTTYNQHLDAIDQAKKAHQAQQQQLYINKLKSIQFLNIKGETKQLFQLFKQSDSNQLKQAPIEYSSEQNCPKLLQAAFKFGYTPIALAEFWWGASPFEQIRQHKNIYPVCQSKCFEILEHMLDGIAVDDSPLEQTPSYGKELEIVYEDEAIVVVNKPAEFLSVSGKFITDSVHARIKKRYPNATGPLIVHRLDMSTSGLLILTLTAEANKNVQKQFIARTVEKRYTALLEGHVDNQSGIITLPLCGDEEDKPRQMVSISMGRSAETSYRVISRENNRTKVYLYPKTGRTHQLRVHCAHQAGLGTPIVGDDLYGFKANRLHLHAGYLKFSHPITHLAMEFSIDADF